MIRIHGSHSRKCPCNNNNREASAGKFFRIIPSYIYKVIEKKMVLKSEANIYCICIDYIILRNYK